MGVYIFIYIYDMGVCIDAVPGQRRAIRASPENVEHRL